MKNNKSRDNRAIALDVPVLYPGMQQTFAIKPKVALARCSKAANNQTDNAQQYKKAHYISQSVIDSAYWVSRQNVETKVAF